MQVFTQTVVAIGRVGPKGVSMLGTGFFVRADGYVATTRHVVGDNEIGLAILAPHINDINAYQDVSDTQCQPISAEIVETDPIKDLSIIKINGNFSGTLPPVGGFDDVAVANE